MAADDLSAPLGQETKRGLRPFYCDQGIAAASHRDRAWGLFLGAFVLWALMADNPFGGEPMAVVQIARRPGQRRRGSSADRPRRADRPWWRRTHPGRPNRTGP